MFPYTTNTQITLDGKPHTVRFYDGMSGIGSREFWLNGRRYPLGAVTQSADLTDGNHLLYLMKWRDTPWDKLYIFVHEDELETLLSEENAWREPTKVQIPSA